MKSKEGLGKGGEKNEIGTASGFIIRCLNFKSRKGLVVVKATKTNTTAGGFVAKQERHFARVCLKHMTLTLKGKHSFLHEQRILVLRTLDDVSTCLLHPLNKNKTKY